MIEKAKKICKEHGVELILVHPINLNRLNLFWYGGNTIILKKGNREVVIAIVGDVSFTVFKNPNRDVEYIYYNKNNTPLDDSDLEKIIPDDATMEKLIKEDRIYWNYNNWVEFGIYENDKQVSHVTDAEVASLAEVFEDINYYIDLI